MTRLLAAIAALALLPSLALAQAGGVTVRQLTSAPSVSFTDIIPVEQTSGLRGATVQQLVAAIAGTGLSTSNGQINVTGALLSANNLSDCPQPSLCLANIGGAAAALVTPIRPALGGL